MLGKLLESFKQSDLKSVSGLDAAFLYAESPTSPMHIGSVAVIEGNLDYETFRNRIASRIHLIPKMRKRLVYVPMSIDYPYWADDPNFDLDMHMQHIALPKPGGWKQLRDVTSHIFSEQLDQNRPLWSFTFVEGLDNIPQVPKGSVAIVSKIHHVAIDGMAGAGILGLLFDFTPEPPKEPTPEPWNPKPLPNEVSMVIKSTSSFAENPLKFPKLLTEAVKSSVKAGMLTRVQQADLPESSFTAPNTPLNGLRSARRVWNTAILSLERIKALKNIMGTTMNDVMLAICAGALRRWLDEKGKLPARPLVAMVPISVRDDSDDMNNQISSMLVQLATNVEDPIERLEVIHENTVRGKIYQSAMGAKTLAKMAEIVPFGVANQAARLYSRFQMAEMHNPIANCTITNVPGPQFPLYLSGHKLLAILGLAPIIDGMGLIITIFSYNGYVTITSTSDAKTMPDIREFSIYIRESANELEALILKRGKKKKRQEAKKTDTKKTDAYFENLKKRLKKEPELIQAKGVFNFEITGDAAAQWKIDNSKAKISIRRGHAAEPDAIINIADAHIQKIDEGDLDWLTAQVQGRVKVNGEESLGNALLEELSA